MSAASHPSSFAGALRAERQGFVEFSALLEAERDALAGPDAEPLGNLALAKTACIDRLSELAARRVSYLRALSLTPDRNGFQRWLQHHAGADAASAAGLWDELVESARRARNLHEANGALIQARLRFTDQALAVLHGAENPRGTYGPDGHSRAPASGRTLGQA